MKVKAAEGPKEGVPKLNFSILHKQNAFQQLGLKLKKGH